MPAKIPSYRPKARPRRRRADTTADLSAEAHERRKFLQRAAWRKLRLAHLRSNPLCQDCQDRGETKAAEEVHHIEKRADAPEMQMDGDNLRSLCRACHGVRTKRGE